MRATLQRALLIVVAGVLCGLAANAISPRRLPYRTPPKPVLPAADTIALTNAVQLWQSGAGLFLDARAPADYAAGHIPFAHNLPVEGFDARYPAIAPMLSPALPLVLYCDGVECELSHQLLAKLRPLGFTNAHVLVNGMSVWRAAKLPVNQGAEP
jgi:rhodanese-related sulfurtransferase